MTSSDSLISACTALSNPPTGTHYNAAFFLSPAGVLTSLDNPVAQNLNGPTGTFIMMLMFNISASVTVLQLQLSYIM